MVPVVETYETLGSSGVSRGLPGGVAAKPRTAMDGGGGGHKECSWQEECVCVQKSWGGERCEEPGDRKGSSTSEEGMGFMACAGKEHYNTLIFNLSFHSGKMGNIFML